jgi:hypothetical protein
MATTNIGKPFGVVTSKNQATAITESKQDANSGQFYITRTNISNTGDVGNTEGNASEAISLTINGNVLRGISKEDAIKLAGLSTNTHLTVGSGLTKTGNNINLNLGTGLNTDGDRKVGVNVADWLITSDNNNIILDVNNLSGTTKDDNLCYYSKGGIYFSNTIKSGQKFDNVLTEEQLSTKKYLQIRCGTGLAFQEGYQAIGSNSSQIIGRDGKYYVNIDDTTIGLNKNSELAVKHDDSLETTYDGLSVKLPSTVVVPQLEYLPVSTSAILVAEKSYGLCVDIPALTRLVKLIMGVK